MRATSPSRWPVLRLEVLEDRLVPSSTPVTDTTQYPFSAIVRIEAHFPDQPSNQYFQATGTLIDSFHVLTAAHILYDSAEGGFADQVRVFPGQQNSTDAPFGELFATEERVFNEFVTNDNRGVYDEHGDLGLITLDGQVGNTTGTLAMGFNSDPSFYTNLGVNNAGYPVDSTHDGFTMYRQFGNLTGVSSDGALLNWTYSQLTTIAGQSGSPLWEYQTATGSRVIYGVLVAGDDSNQIGFGVRLTQPIIADIESWEAQDAAPTGLSGSLQPITASEPTPTSLGSGAGEIGGLVKGPIGGTISTGIGTVDPTTATWYLRAEADAGGADVGSFQFGVSGWVPISGDWNGDGTTGIGMYDPTTATWYLRNEANAGGADAGVFQFGAPGWIPVVGDWNGDSTIGIGVFDPTTATFYLRNEASGGAADAGVFQYGLPGWKPVVGDWNGGASTGIGVFNPSTATWYLRNEASGGGADAGVFQYGAPGWQPITGSWTGSSTTGIGVIDPASGMWYLRNEPSGGGADAGVFGFGLGTWIGVSGAWRNGPDTATSALRLSPSTQATVPTTSASGPSPLDAAVFGLSPLEDELLWGMGDWKRLK
jgi:V8-like Glu-specific endopeptidase